MATIEEISGQGTPAFVKELRAMADEQLLAQQFVQQGAVHALSMLLKIGCTESNVVEMLSGGASRQAKSVRDRSDGIQLNRLESHKMRRRKPTARVADNQPKSEEVLWQIEWPSSAQAWGKTYFAAVLGQTGVVRVITAAKRLPASAAVAAKLVPAIQCAIARAQSS